MAMGGTGLKEEGVEVVVHTVFIFNNLRTIKIKKNIKNIHSNMKKNKIIINHFVVENLLKISHILVLVCPIDFI